MVSSRESRVVIASAMVLALLSGVSVAQNPPSPDNVRLLLDKATIMGGSTGAFGGFTYDAGRNCIWIAIYGTDQAFRRIDNYEALTDDDPDTNPVGTTLIAKDMIDRFCRASDVPGGVTSAFNGGLQRPFALLLNKTTLDITIPNPSGSGTVTLTYPPGNLLFSCDQPTAVSQGGSTFRGDWTKMMYRYDMRKVQDPVDPAGFLNGQPDYGNAQDGANVTPLCPADQDPNYSLYFYPATPPYTRGWGCGFVDWNDLFTVVCTDQQFLTAAGVSGAAVPSTGRQAAWSSDGHLLYWNASDSSFGGIYRIDAETGALAYIYQSKGGTPALNTEVAVIATSLRDLDPANPTAGDQVLFRGTGNANNAYGISYIIDDGVNTSGPFTLLSKADFDRWMEWNGKYSSRTQNTDGSDPGVNTVNASSPDTWSMIAGDDGTLYFVDNGSQGGLWRYDPQKRLSGFRSLAQQVRWYLSIGSTSTNKQELRPQLRDVSYPGMPGTVPQYLSRDNGITGIAGVYIFKPGDFNRDNALDAADLTLFNAALATPIATFSTGTDPSMKFYEAPTDGTGAELETVDVQGYLDYLKCDMNNNGLVTPKDRQILGRFLGKGVCDYDWDGDVDMDEFGHFQECYTGAALLGALQQTRCDDADLNGDLKVDGNDLTVFQNCAGGANVPADVNCGL